MGCDLKTRATEYLTWSSINKTPGVQANILSDTQCLRWDKVKMALGEEKV